MRLSSIIALLFLSSACRTESSAADAQAEERDPDGPREAQILDIIKTVHTGEIDLGKQAIARSSDQRVKDFAQTMVTEHTEGITRADALGRKIGVEAAASEWSVAQMKHGNDVMASLKDKVGPDFDKAYADAMAEGHADVLDMIRTELMPQAANEDVRAELRTLESSVSAHLTHAKALVEQLAANPIPPPPVVGVVDAGGPQPTPPAAPVAGFPVGDITPEVLTMLVEPRLGVYVENHHGSTHNNQAVAHQRWIRVEDIQTNSNRADDPMHAALVAPLSQLAQLRTAQSAEAKCDEPVKACDVSTKDGHAHFVFLVPAGTTELRLVGVMLHDGGATSAEALKSFDKIVHDRVAQLDSGGQR